MSKLPNYSLQEYLQAVDQFLERRHERKALPGPQNMRFGRLYLFVGVHSFEATWRNQSLVQGRLPHHDALNLDMVADRAEYACGLVKWALERIDLEKGA